MTFDSNAIKSSNRCSRCSATNHLTFDCPFRVPGQAGDLPRGGAALWSRMDCHGLCRGGAAFPSQFSINWRELHAAVKALASWAPSLAGTKVMFHIDNSTTCFVLNKYYSPIPELMELIRCWCLLIEQYSITVAVVYIPTDDNVWADALSRGDIDRFLGSYQGGGGGASPYGLACLHSVL